MSKRRHRKKSRPSPDHSPPGDQFRAPPRPKKKPRPNHLGSGSPMAKPADPRDLSALLAYGPSYLPFTAAWTDSRTQQVQAFKHWVFVAINKIATKVCSKHPNISYLSSSPSEDYQARALYHKTFPGVPDSYIKQLPPGVLRLHLSRRSQYQVSRALAPLLSEESLQPVEHNHPLRVLLSDPNTPDTAWTLWYETVLFFLLTGSAYWWLPPNNAKRPEAIWVLPSHWVWPLVGKSGQQDGWELRPVEGNYLKQFLPLEQVIQFKKPNPVSKIDGYTPTSAVARTIDVSEAISLSRLQAFRNGMTPTAVVQFDGSLNDPSDDMLRRIEAKFISRAVGETRSNRPLFVPPGVSVKPLTLKPNEMVWGENADETARNLLAAFDVPWTVGIGSASDEEMVQFLSGAVDPVCSLFGQVLSEKLCPFYAPSRSLRIWWEDFVPDDPAHLEETIKTDLMCGAITPNEVRILRGRQPYPEAWADRPVLPVNMAPLTTPQGGQHQDPGMLLPTNLPDMPNISDEPKYLRTFSTNGHHRG